MDKAFRNLSPEHLTLVSLVLEKTALPLIFTDEILLDSLTLR